jgi:hypothetical protein
MTTNQRLKGKAMTKDELLALLEEIRNLIEVDDSWEGLVNWLMPEDSDPNDTYARVEARYRMGNSMGQGGFRIIGEWINENEHEIRHVNPGKGL